MIFANLEIVGEEGLIFERQGLDPQSIWRGALTGDQPDETGGGRRLIGWRPRNLVIGLQGSRWHKSAPRHMERMLGGGLNDLSRTSGRIFQRKVDLHRILMAEHLGNRLEGVCTCFVASSKNTIASLQLLDRLQPFACRNQRSRVEAAVNTAYSLLRVPGFTILHIVHVLFRLTRRCRLLLWLWRGLLWLGRVLLWLGRVLLQVALQLP